MSNLTKAAVFGHDPNWGRIACAAGYSGVKFDPNDLDVTLGPMKLMEAGQPLPFDKAAASKYLKDVTSVHGICSIKVSLGKGSGKGMAWGCDLSYEYVKINAGELSEDAEQYHRHDLTFPISVHARRVHHLSWAPGQSTFVTNAVVSRGDLFRVQ